MKQFENYGDFIAMKTPSKIKIAYIIDSINSISGTEKQLIQIIELLDPEIFETVLFALRPPKTVFQFDKKRIKYIELGIKSILSFKSILKTYWLCKYLRRNKIDIVQTYFMDSDMIGIIAGKIANVKKIICCRRDLGFWYTPNILRILKVVTKFVDNFLVNSIAIKEKISKCEFIPSRKIDVIYNGIRLEPYDLPYDANHFKRKLGIKNDNYVVGITAHFNRHVKRGDVFIKAAAEVIKIIPNVTFIVVGSKLFKRELESLANSLHVREKIIFVGIQEDIPPILKSWDLGVNCSDSEGFSNSILEYMASGLPVVATDVGGNKEVIEEGVNGFLVDPGDHKSMARKICILLRDKDRRLNIGKNAKTIVQRKYSWNSKIREIETYYRNLLEF